MHNVVCLLSFLLWSCVTDAKNTKDIKWKYDIGQCVRFDPAKFKNSDGTPILIVNRTNKTKLYSAQIEHPLVPGITSFTALKIPFEQDTITTPCKKGTK
jgi:hypothetical protein